MYITVNVTSYTCMYIPVHVNASRRCVVSASVSIFMKVFGKIHHFSFLWVMHKMQRLVHFFLRKQTTQKKKQKIRWLDLENNNVNSAGAAAISECLKTNSSLTLLHLSANNIGDTVSSFFLHTHTHACVHMRSRTHKRTYTHTYTLTHTYTRICLLTTSATL